MTGALFIILVCMVGEAFFSGMETGVISIHRMRLRHFVRRGSRGARILYGFLENSDRLLGTTLVGTNICVVVISVVAAGMASRRWGPGAETMSAGAVSILILIFCEYLPKAWFHSRPLERCQRYAGLLHAASVVFAPMSVALMWVTNRLVPGGGKSFSKPQPFVTREDLKVLAREGEKDGVLSKRERVMIHRVFELSGKRAGDIMVPRDEMTVIDTRTPIPDFFDVARQSGFTRMPVYDPDKQTFVGIINVFYVLSAPKHNGDSIVDEFARPPMVIREDMPVDDIFPLLRRSRQPMCLVKDADGEVSGLITTEDILEEIVGEL